LQLKEEKRPLAVIPFLRLLSYSVMDDLFFFWLAVCGLLRLYLSCGSGGFSGCVMVVNEHVGFF
jgi:hypothetical protein